MQSEKTLSDAQLEVLSTFSTSIGMPMWIVCTAHLTTRFPDLVDAVSKRAGENDELKLCRQLAVLVYQHTYLLQVEDRYQVVDKLIRLVPTLKCPDDDFLACVKLTASQPIMIYRTAKDAFIALHAALTTFIKEPVTSARQENASSGVLVPVPVMAGSPSAFVAPTRTATTTTTTGHTLPSEHDELLKPHISRVMSMFCKALNMTENEILTHVLTPQVAHLAGIICSKNSRNVDSGPLFRVAVLMIMRFLLKVPRDERVAFMVELQNTLPGIEPCRGEDVPDLIEEVLLEHEVQPEMDARLCMVHLIASILLYRFGTLKSDIPDILMNKLPKNISLEMYNRAANIRTFLVAHNSMHRLTGLWDGVQSVGAKRKHIPRRNSKRTPKPTYKRQKTLRD